MDLYMCVYISLAPKNKYFSQLHKVAHICNFFMRLHKYLQSLEKYSFVLD